MCKKEEFMKKITKILVFVLCVILLVCCCACGEQTDNTNSQNSNGQTGQGGQGGQGQSHNHSYTNRVESSAYLKTPATCTSGAVYYYSCSCGAKGTSTFVIGNGAGHKYTSKNTESKFLKEASTCQHSAVYYYSCECGKKGTNTFEYGQTGDHKFVKKVDDKYLYKAATLTEPAYYWYSCVYCEKRSSQQYFEFGEPNSSLVTYNLSPGKYSYGYGQKIGYLEIIETKLATGSYIFEDGRCSLNFVVSYKVLTSSNELGYLKYKVYNKDNVIIRDTLIYFVAYDAPIGETIRKSFNIYGNDTTIGDYPLRIEFYF